MTKIEELETELWHEKVRNGTIEECARVAELGEHSVGKRIATAIRALKDTTREE